MPVLLTTTATGVVVLSPKIEINISVQEVGALNVSNQRFFGRSITIEITLTNIRVNEAKDAIARVFLQAQTQVLSNINPIIPANSTPLEALQKPVDNGKSKISIEIDNSGEEPLVNIYLQIGELRQEYVPQTLASFKEYIFAAIDNDLNL